GMAQISGRGRVDLRFAEDNEGELYILTKSDGMIRKVVGVRATTTQVPATTARTSTPADGVTGETTARLRNPVGSTPASLSAGKRTYDINCAACHRPQAQGAVKAGMSI